MVLACCLWGGLAWGSPGLSIPDGHGAGSFSLLDGGGLSGLGFFDSLDAGDLCFLGAWGAQGPWHPWWHGGRWLWLLWWTLLSQTHSDGVPCLVTRCLSFYRHLGMTWWLVALLGLCWPSPRDQLNLQEEWCSWTWWSWLWEGWWWGLPLEVPLPSQHHLGHSPGMRCPSVWRLPSACEVEV